MNTVLAALVVNGMHVCRIPLYYELKLVFIVWLINPGTRGAELLYNQYLWKILKDYASKWDPTFKSDNEVRPPCAVYLYLM